MEFQVPLVKARLTRRYKRFLADAVLLDGPRAGEEVVAHCANPGAMTGLAEPGTTIFLAPAGGKGRKLEWSWKLVSLPDGHWAGVDTAVPNRVVGEALRAGAIPELSGYAEIRPEVRYAEKSRVDFLLSDPARPDCYVEVKNVHLRRDGDLAEFPDSVTARGARHLDDLAAMAGQGARAAMLYLVQRTDCGRFALAADIDPAYAAAFARARAAGVEAYAYATEISPTGVSLARSLPVIY